MTEFNDRRLGTGPKDLTSLGMAAIAYRKLRESQDALANGNPKAQGAVDDAFEELAEMHRDSESGEIDTASLQDTLKFLGSHYQKGKTA